MRFSRRCVSLAVLACLAWTSSAQAAELRVGISNDNPPWSFAPERLSALVATDAPLPPALLERVNVAVRELLASPEMAEIRKQSDAFGK